MIVSLFLLIFVVISNVSARIGCKGLNGEKVDWFVAYKLPSGVKDANLGKDFMYADNKNPSLVRSKKNIDDSGIAVGATITQAYRRTSSFAFMYNDDSPTDKSEGYRGHAKGVVLFDSSTGLWMIHSLPNFPPTSSYSYPQTAVKYAQSFICVTLNTENLNVIGDHLRFIQATPFQSNLPEKFATKFPVLRQVVAKQSLPKSATVFTAAKHMKTSDGATIHAFAKHKKFNKDLWFNLLAAETQSSFDVQTWLNGGADDLHTNCGGKYSVYDMQTISVPGLIFNSTKDHSKWGVSESEKIPLVCIGDVNRQSSQLKRGGGALCLENLSLWKAYKSTVSKVEPCPVKSKVFNGYLCSFLISILFLLENLQNLTSLDKFGSKSTFMFYNTPPRL